MKHFIENDFIRIGCESLGGCLCSVFDKTGGEEILYQPEPDSWQGQDVAIFPFIARLKSKTYTYGGKTYSLRNHGICRYHEFEFVVKTKTMMKLALRYNVSTLKEYPFEFLFIVTYRISGAKLIVSYDALNLGDSAMPFGIGAHPAFRIDPSPDGDTAGNYVVLEKPMALSRVVFDEKGEFVHGEEDYGIKDRLETDKKTFEVYKTLCVRGEDLHHVVLERKNGRKVDFQFNDINYLVLWSFPESGAFVAIEPWMSLPDFVDAEKDISKKKTLLSLESGEKYHFSYSVSI